MARDSFSNLIKTLTSYRVAVDEPYLDGLLTGCATIPVLDADGLHQAISGGQPLAEAVRDAIRECVSEQVLALESGEFRARFDGRKMADGKQWLEGYFEAVRIHESDWEEHNQLHPDGALCLVMMHSMANANFNRDATMNLPGPDHLKKHPASVTELALDIYALFHSDTDGEGLIGDDALVSWLQIPPEELISMDESELMAVVTTSDDVLPFDVVKECASRGDAIVPFLARHLEADAHWGDDPDEGDWWALLHALFILGLIPGEASAQALLSGFRRATSGDEKDLTDWVSSYWPALCRNKRELTTGPMRQIVQNETQHWQSRSEAVLCVLADVAETGGETLESAIDWLAALCGDPTGDPAFRVLAGCNLVDFGRERHSPVMEGLLDLQVPDTPLANFFSQQQIHDSLDSADSPGWEQFENPWQFYDPDEIERRQARWLREDEEFERSLIEPRQSQTYMRPAPKIGRNEPCPCGSGKKHKKCCMNIVH